MYCRAETEPAPTIGAAVDFPAMPTLTTYATEYVTGRERRGEITPVTASTIRQHLDGFCDAFGNRPLDQIGPWVVERWLESIAHLRPSTRAIRLVNVRNFSAWLVDQGHIRRDITRCVKPIRRPRHEPRNIGLDHFIACLAACVDDRERLVVWLMFGLGLRCVEVSRLTVDDYDPMTNELRVDGKARHERVLPVPNAVRRVLSAHLAQRGLAWGPLIDNRHRPGEPLSPGRVSNMVYLIVRRSGLPKQPFDGFSAHGLRAAAASDLLEAADYDLRVVQEFLGHASLATTARYIRRAGMARMRDALEARKWRSAS